MTPPLFSESAGPAGLAVSGNPALTGRAGAVQPPTLYLIDGYAQFFRAYHAIRTPMTSPVTREPTNMTFGFVGMLLKLLRGEGRIGGRPAYVAVALDISGDKETFRSEIDPQYKANRPPPPQDLFPQVDRCIALLKAIGVPTVGVEGFEADDAIATVVSRLRRERPELRIRIVSKDKDLKQLLEPPARPDGGGAAGGPGGPGGGGGGMVELFDIHTDLVIDAAALKAETGLEPRQVIDMLALMGDTVDNVKGVEGVGPKTAAELIATHGSLQGLIEHAGEVKGKRGDALRAAIADGRLPRNITLVSLRHDAPVELDLEQAKVAGLKLGELLPILRELGFNRYQDEVKALMDPGGGAGAGASGGGEPARGAPGPGGPLAAPAASRPRRAAAGPAGPGLFDAIGGVAEQVPARERNAGYVCVRTREELDSVIDRLRQAEIFALDTETTGLNPRRSRLCGISLAVEEGAGWYIPMRSPEPGTHVDEGAVLSALKPILEDPDRPKCGHNLKFDMLMLRGAGLRLRGVTFDSMVGSYVLDASRSSHGLDALALGLLNHTNIPISELLGAGGGAGGERGGRERTFDQVPLDRATQYAAEDADIALRLRNRMHPELAEKGLLELFEGVEMPLVEVLAELEWNGIAVDAGELDRQRDRLSGQIAELRRKIDDAAFAALGCTFNPDSPKQLAAALFNKPSDEPPGLGLKAVKRTKTGKSTDIEVLETLAQDVSITTPIPGLIVDYRQLTKLVSTYLVALKEAIEPAEDGVVVRGGFGRIHASFNQTVAVTGRLASSDPNLQNIPIRSDVGREIRRAFVAPPGRVFVSADYSQIELRLLAHLSRDPALIEAFRQDQDIHTAVAAQINKVAPDQVTREQRAGAKMVNFGIIYGITPFGLARRLGIGNEEASEIITAYKRRFAGITTFLQECVEQARTHGYVETILKRRRPIPDIDSNIPARRAFAERTAINSVVQGSAADLIKLAMLDVYGILEEGSRAGVVQRVKRDAAAVAQERKALEGVQILLQIHDELVFEAPAETAEGARKVIVGRMERAMDLSVPLKADSSVAGNWFDGK